MNRTKRATIRDIAEALSNGAWERMPGGSDPAEWEAFFRRLMGWMTPEQRAAYDSLPHKTIWWWLGTDREATAKLAEAQRGAEPKPEWVEAAMKDPAFPAFSAMLESVGFIHLGPGHWFRAWPIFRKGWEAHKKASFAAAYSPPEKRSLEQVVRDALESFIKTNEGEFRLQRSLDEGGLIHQTIDDPQELGSSDLVGPANVLSHWLMSTSTPVPVQNVVTVDLKQLAADMGDAEGRDADEWLDLFRRLLKLDPPPEKKPDPIPAFSCPMCGATVDYEMEVGTGLDFRFECNSTVGTGRPCGATGRLIDGKWTLDPSRPAWDTGLDDGFGGIGDEGDGEEDPVDDPGLLETGAPIKWVDSGHVVIEGLPPGCYELERVGPASLRLKRSPFNMAEVFPRDRVVSEKEATPEPVKVPVTAKVEASFKTATGAGQSLTREVVDVDTVRDEVRRRLLDIEDKETDADRSERRELERLAEERRREREDSGTPPDLR